MINYLYLNSNLCLFEMRRNLSLKTSIINILPLKLNTMDKGVFSSLIDVYVEFLVYI